MYIKDHDGAPAPAELLRHGDIRANLRCKLAQQRAMYLIGLVTCPNRAVAAPQLTKEEGTLDVTQPAETLHNQVSQCSKSLRSGKQLCRPQVWSTVDLVQNPVAR